MNTREGTKQTKRSRRAPVQRRHERANLRELSDRQVMRIIASCEDSDGFVDTRAVADTANITHDNALKCVASRLSWMRRFGLMEKDREKNVWTISSAGRRLLDSDPKIQPVPVAPEDWAASVAMHAMTAGRKGPIATRMARREWKHYTDNPSDGGR